MITATHYAHLVWIAVGSSVVNLCFLALWSSTENKPQGLIMLVYLSYLSGASWTIYGTVKYSQESHLLLSVA